MKVEIKERRLPTGNRSLYLEYYETGFRKKEYLGIFLVPEDSARARRLNGEALRKAQEIKAKRILCLQTSRVREEEASEEGHRQPYMAGMVRRVYQVVGGLRQQQEDAAAQGCGAQTHSVIP